MVPYFLFFLSPSQEAAALAAILQAGQRRRLQFTIAPGPTPVSPQDQV